MSESAGHRPSDGVADPRGPGAALAPFAAHRRLLFTVAYEMTGSAADAEDVVQEAWLRWSSADRSDVLDPRAYLVRVTTRLALDRLRALRTRRETYVGSWLPDPLLTTPDAALQVERAEDVSMALLVVLETLSPLERAVFVLREVFDVPYDEIAEGLDRSPEAVRQTAHRAREHVRARRPRFTPPDDAQRAAVERFMVACATGDTTALVEVLAPDVVVVSDGGGKARAALRPVAGADKVARMLVGLSAKPETTAMAFEPALVNGALGGVWTVDGVPAMAASVEYDGERVVRVLLFRNPERLAGLRRA
ncbi:RNA polymerase sigma-70 factor (ECF subfamily) [Cellulosimicrobium cellulans]|uniref:RNA polymerase sigma-70 factor n=1 Tax=Cellulosimicrobium cellulans TaxID=1710 RepID=UPI0019596BF5|nr:RNA polymerase sigma-70 factor [Cellulosimicrobium cellulans]MBM7820499.1 RNA polymerase sigma-70 factor (ECF subfamily) [Cellulosimicrobium cellulans]